MSKLSESVINVIKDKGWLALGHMIFDNSNVCFVANSNGNVAYSSDTASFYWLSTMDTNDTLAIKTDLIVSDTKHLDCMATLTQSDEDCLQWVSYNLGYRSTMLRDARLAKKGIPYPKFPKADELKALKKNEKTGLYDGYPYVEFGTSDSDAVQQGVKVPVIEMLKKDDNKIYTGDDNDCLARIDDWKNFYEQHERFCEFLKNSLGLKNIL